MHLLMLFLVLQVSTVQVKVKYLQNVLQEHINLMLSNLNAYNVLQDLLVMVLAYLYLLLVQQTQYVKQDRFEVLDVNLDIMQLEMHVLNVQRVNIVGLFLVYQQQGQMMGLLDPVQPDMYVKEDQVILCQQEKLIL